MRLELFRLIASYAVQGPGTLAFHFYVLVRNGKEQGGLRIWSCFQSDVCCSSLPVKGERSLFLNRRSAPYACRRIRSRGSSGTLGLCEDGLERSCRSLADAKKS